MTWHKMPVTCGIVHSRYFLSRVRREVTGLRTALATGKPLAHRSVKQWRKAEPAPLNLVSKLQRSGVCLRVGKPKRLYQPVGTRVVPSMDQARVGSEKY